MIDEYRADLPTFQKTGLYSIIASSVRAAPPVRRGNGLIV